MRRHKYGQRRAVGNGSLLLVGILILAVAAGYAGTKYVIAPYILDGKLWAPGQSRQEGGEPGQTAGTSGAGIVSGQQNIQDAKNMTTDTAVKPADSTESAVAPTLQPAQQGQTTAAAAGQPAQNQNQTQGQVQSTGGYAVQFGSFSTKTAADQAVADLAAKNITASVLQKDGAYKVIGSTFDTKEKAKAEADRLRSAAKDAFVTVI